MAPVKKELADLGRTYIAEWREARGLTQEQLAERISMSRSTLSKMETSDSPYTQRSLEAIAVALRCKPHELLMPVVGDDQRTPEMALRSAMIAYGVDYTQLDRAVQIISTFVTPQSSGEQSERNLSDDRSQPASRRHESVPSR